ncbi:MAG: cytochrome P450 [Cyanophyceae cyanobacterium]
MPSPNLLSSPAPVQLAHWIANPVGFMEGAAKRYDDFFTAKIGFTLGDLVFVSHPQAIQQLMQERRTFLAPGYANRLIEPLVGEYSVIMREGDRHRRARQLLMPPFHGERLRTYGELICHITKSVMNQLEVGQPCSARSVMQQISLQVILEAVFGLHEGEASQQLKQLLAAMTEIFRSPLTSSFLFFRFLQQDFLPWNPWKYFVHQRQQLDQLLYAEITQRRAQAESTRQDILSLLLSARDEAGNPMTDQELRDELMTLLFAGHETTATAMAWALYWSHFLPEVKEQLLQELASADEDPMSIARLPYLTAVCQETLRIYPVAMLMFPRIAQEPVELMGHPLEPGTAVMGCIYLVHQREELYPHPKQFQPERFLERQYANWEFLPFGGGSRRCVGDALALLEMKLVLATILKHYELDLVGSKPEQPQRRGVTLAPSGRVKMVINKKG